MLVRPARPEDARAVEEVRIAGWRAAYGGIVPAAFLEALLVDEERVAWRERSLREPEPYDVVLVAEQDGLVVGAAALGPAQSADPGPNSDEDLDPATTAELRTLYVAPSAWGTGVGGRLLDEGFALLPHPQQVLWTLERNASARRFYERRGFVHDDRSRVLDLGGPVVEVHYRRARP